MVHVSEADVKRLRAQAKALHAAGLGGAVLAAALAAAPIVGPRAAGFLLSLAGAAVLAGVGLLLAHMSRTKHALSGLANSVALYAGGLATLGFLFLGPPLTGIALLIPLALTAYLASKSSPHAPTLALLLPPLAFTLAAWWTSGNSNGVALWGVLIACIALLASELLRIGTHAIATFADALPSRSEAPEGVASAGWVAATLAGRIAASILVVGATFLLAGILVLNREALLAIDILASLDVALAAALLAGAGAGLAYLTVRKPKETPPRPDLPYSQAARHGATASPGREGTGRN